MTIHMPKYFPSLSHEVAEKEKNNGYCKAFCIVYKRNNKSCKNISVKSFLAFNVLKLNQKQILRGPKKLLVPRFGCTLTKCCMLYPRFNDIPENNLMLNVFIHSIRGNISFFKKWATVTAEPDFPHTYFIKNKHNQKPIDRETTLLSYCLLKHKILWISRHQGLNLEIHHSLMSWKMLLYLLYIRKKTVMLYTV